MYCTMNAKEREPVSEVVLWNLLHFTKISLYCVPEQSFSRLFSKDTPFCFITASLDRAKGKTHCLCIFFIPQSCSTGLNFSIGALEKPKGQLRHKDQWTRSVDFGGRHPFFQSPFLFFPGLELDKCLINSLLGVNLFSN